VSADELLQRIKASWPEVEVILLTGHATVDTAIRCMQEGAFDYLTKPLNKDSLIMTVKRAAEHAALVKENLIDLDT
jgi:DNA-binding NtrC family response regulator